MIYILLRRVSRNLPNKLSLQLKPLLLKLDTSRKVLSTELVHLSAEVLEVVVKAAESADGWQVCAAKKLSNKKEKPQKHHFAST